MFPSHDQGGAPTDPGAGVPSGGPHLHFEVLVSKTVDKKVDYDSYQLEKNGETFTFEGDSKVNAYGAVDPLFFSYPHQLFYPEDQEQRLKEQIPRLREPPQENTTSVEESSTETSQTIDTNSETNTNTEEVTIPAGPF